MARAFALGISSARTMGTFSFVCRTWDENMIEPKTMKIYNIHNGIVCWNLLWHWRATSSKSFVSNSFKTAILACIEVDNKKTRLYTREIGKKSLSAAFNSISSIEGSASLTVGSAATDNLGALAICGRGTRISGASWYDAKVHSKFVTFMIGNLTEDIRLSRPTWLCEEA